MFCARGDQNWSTVVMVLLRQYRSAVGVMSSRYDAETTARAVRLVGGTSVTTTRGGRRSLRLRAGSG